MPRHDPPPPQSHLHTFGVGHCDALRSGVPLRTVALRPHADEDHECRWVGEGGLGKISIGVVAGPGAMLCTIWGERVDALVHAWKAAGEKRT